MIEIYPSKKYNLNEIVKLGLFEGVKSYQMYKNRVLEDLALGRKSLLKAKMSGEGKGKRIVILGRNLINYIEHGKKEGSSR